MNKQLARTNEFRKYQRQIRIKYGDNVEIVDCHSSWLIESPIGRDIYGINYRMVWTGTNLRDSIHSGSNNKED